MFISKDRQVTLFEKKRARPAMASALTFALAAAFLLSPLVNCQNPVDKSGDDARFTFTVADVGQGLAQFGVMDGRAVVWDLGTANQYPAWRAAYGGLGDPRIEIIVISHSDEDHYGGLRRLDAGLNWNGTIAVSPLEDTTKIRTNSGVWGPRIKFQLIAAGDTLKIFNSVEIICLWPPREVDLELPLDGALRNRYGLVFSVRHNHARALITSDIDSVAMLSIAASAGHELRAQLLSVPHHGSAGSVNDLFFAYVSAEKAVFSCARQNNYGHPSTSMIDILAMAGTKLFYTYLDGTVTFSSNGWYWQ